jgi:Holliday junction resolvase RusA-like endonuclease
LILPRSEITSVGGVIRALAITIDEPKLPRCGKGNDRLPRKNKYWERNRRTGTQFRGALAEGFIRALRAEAARLGLDPDKACPPIRSGWWTLDLIVGSPSQLKSLDVIAPRTDADACLSPVKDALQYAGVLDNDARICRDSASTVLSISNPFVVFRLERIENPQSVVRVRWPWASYFG